MMYVCINCNVKKMQRVNFISIIMFLIFDTLITYRKEKKNIINYL